MAQVDVAYAVVKLMLRRTAKMLAVVRVTLKLPRPRCMASSFAVSCGVSLARAAEHRHNFSQACYDALQRLGNSDKGYTSMHDYVSWQCCFMRVLLHDYVAMKRGGLWMNNTP